MRKVLITGGAGFIGSNLAERLLSDPNASVTIFDNLSRPGVEHNVEWLRSLEAGRRLTIVQGDVRDAKAVRKATENATEIFHLAAQVAVTTSVADPLGDFDVNARGTLHVLEGARLSGHRPFVLFTSTNKVYGSLPRLPVVLGEQRYLAEDSGFAGVSESELLDFHSPYGCSKGSADQYVRDYSRIYDLPTVVFRMSCIAGPRQFGNEDQGWVAHFLYSALAGRKITVYGNGFQVRDVLHVRDLIDAMLEARDKSSVTAGQVYNVGGGMSRALSVGEMLRAIEKRVAGTLQIEYKPVRPGDQPLYISSTAKLSDDTGWKPSRSVSDILEDIQRFWHNGPSAVFGVAREAVIEQEVA